MYIILISLHAKTIEEFPPEDGILHGNAIGIKV